jgi:hypothetical protein
MSVPSDPLLLTKKAQKLVGKQEAMPGVLIITQSKITWTPDDLTLTKPVTIEISSITSGCDLFV